MHDIPERSVSLSEAEQAIDAYFLNNQINIETKKYGVPLSSTVATLTFPLTGEEPCVGCGKGYDQEALVGAKYEAYEHYQSLKAFRSHCVLTSYEKIIAQDFVKDLLPIKLLSKSEPTFISAIEFAPVIEGSPSLLWPSFLIDYNYQDNRLQGDDADYEDAKRYACGTGFAAGFGFTEAAIHAISEVVERHCVGTYLARTFFYGVDNDLKAINPESLPPVLRQIYFDAEGILGDKIALIDISIGDLPPVYIACCLKKSLGGVYVFGGGCSYYSSHAAARAIKELVQQYAVAEALDFVKDDWRKHKKHLEKYPTLHRCLVADISNKNLVFRDFSGDAEWIDLDKQLNYLFEICNKMGLPVWVKALDNNPSNVTIVAAVMPFMERFSSVSLGNYVVPLYRPI